jgi:hypothetical protein
LLATLKRGRRVFTRTQPPGADRVALPITRH